MRTGGEQSPQYWTTVENGIEASRLEQSSAREQSLAIILMEEI